jgi:hypothetical protein
MHYPLYAAAAMPFRWIMKPEAFSGEKKGLARQVEYCQHDNLAQSHEPELWA